MIAKLIRRWFGSIRFFMALLAFISGMGLALLDMMTGNKGSSAMWAFIGTLLAGGGTGFIWNETKRPSGYDGHGIEYKNEKDGEP